MRNILKCARFLKKISIKGLFKKKENQSTDPLSINAISITTEEFDNMVDDVKWCYNKFNPAIKKAVTNKNVFDHLDEVYFNFTDIENDFKHGKPVRFYLEYKMFWNEENTNREEMTFYLHKVYNDIVKIARQLGFNIGDTLLEFDAKSEKHPNIVISISFDDWEGDSIVSLIVGFAKYVKLEDTKETTKEYK